MERTVATVIGRGHGGTRAAASWLRLAGFDIGETNNSLDRKPFEAIYRAGKLALSTVPREGDRWLVEVLNENSIPDEWRRLWDGYLAGLGDGLVAWKLPETVFSYPWLARCYPEIAYVIWHRDPRDAILRKHITDDLGRWGLCDWPRLSVMEERALSWSVQFDLVESVPLPPRATKLRLRDFVLRQSEVGQDVARVLGVDRMPTHPVRRETLGRWRSKRGDLARAMPVITRYLPAFSD